MIINKEDLRFEVILEHGYSLDKIYDEFKEAVDLLNSERRNYGNPKILCVYKEPAQVYSRRKHRQVNQIEVKFFTGSRSEDLCYTTTGRTGHPVTFMDYSKIEKMVLIHPDAPEKQQQRSKKLGTFWRRVQRELYDDVTWNCLDADSFGNSNYRFYDITKVFDSWDIEGIKKAFEEKTKYSCHHYGTKRHFSVECKMCDDGIYRAWFSSEFSGCANGDYYLLLNPRIAVYYEAD